MIHSYTKSLTHPKCKYKELNVYLCVFVAMIKQYQVDNVCVYIYFKFFKKTNCEELTAKKDVNKNNVGHYSNICLFENYFNIYKTIHLMLFLVSTSVLVETRKKPQLFNLNELPSFLIEG